MAPRSTRRSVPGEGAVDNLPPALSVLVGRDGEVAALVGLVRKHRLVTLTGPGGIGKTRLALEVARATAGSGTGDPWLIDLADAADERTTLAALARIFAVRESQHRRLDEAIVAHLRSRPVLLVLDNCEQVIEPVASLARSLLAPCPPVRLLATSREPLGVEGETVYEVPPLGVPLAGEEMDPAARAGSPSVRLFVDRVVGGVSLTGSAASDVAEICRRLDGVPLAIELAAARVGFLAPAEIAARLDDRFHLLTRGSRGQPPRHRTLLAALEWSHDLLSESERILFRRLGVFRGPWSLAAAETVAAGDGLAAEDVLDALGRLVSQSLVQCDSQGSSTVYTFLETVREFARLKLSNSGEESTTRDTHAAWFTTKAGRAAAALSGADQAAWLDRLEDDLADLRGALEWELDKGRVETALELAGSLVLFWLVRGQMTEGRAWLERCLAAPGAVGVAPGFRSPVLWGAGLLAALLGDFARAWEAATDALELSRLGGGDSEVARALNLLGLINAFRDPAAARPLLEESFAAAERSADSWCLGSSLGYLGFAYAFQGDFTGSRPSFERCLDIARATGDRQCLRTGLLGLSFADLHLGDYARADANLHDGLDVARSLGDSFWTAVAQSYLGDLARVRGEYPAARRFGDAAVDAARGGGSPLLLAFCLSFAGRLGVRRRRKHRRSKLVRGSGDIVPEGRPPNGSRDRPDRPGGAGAARGTRLPPPR